MEQRVVEQSQGTAMINIFLFLNVLSLKLGLLLLLLLLLLFVDQPTGNSSDCSSNETLSYLRLIYVLKFHYKIWG